MAEYRNSGKFNIWATIAPPLAIVLPINLMMYIMFIPINAKLDTLISDNHKHRLIIERRLPPQDLVDLSKLNDLPDVVYGSRETTQTLVDLARSNEVHPDFATSYNKVYLEALNKVQGSIDDKFRPINSQL